MSDARDILTGTTGSTTKSSPLASLLRSSTLAVRGPGAPKKQRKSRTTIVGALEAPGGGRHGKGKVSREVRALTDARDPYFAPLLPAAVPAVRQKLKIRRPATKYVLKRFRAVPGGAVLRAWHRRPASKSAPPPPPPFDFARYNKRIRLVTYDERDEAAYEARGLAADAAWSKPETDALQRLAVRFDARWLVVADRYESERRAAAWPAARTVDELKARYYDVARRLAEPSSALTRFSFDLAAARRRRAHLERLTRRTADDAARETTLAAAYARIDTNFRRTATLDARALRVARGALESVYYYDAADAFVDVDGGGGKKRKAPPTSSSALPPLIMSSTEPDAVGNASRLERFLSPAHLGERLAAQLNATLDELGLALQPTLESPLYVHYLRLQYRIYALLELQRVVAAKRYQAAVLEAHLKQLKEDL